MPAAIFNQMTQPQQPALRDIYRYIGRTSTDLPFSRAEYDATNPGAYFNPTGSSWNRRVETTGGEGGGQSSVYWDIQPGSFLDRLNSQYSAGAAYERGGTSDPADRGSLRMDYSKLPKTRFGTVDMTTSVDDKTKVIDPRFVYDDPVYGKITHKKNVKSGNEMVGPALMMLLSMGMGGLVSGAAGASAAQNFRTAMGAVQAARGFGSGGSPWGALLNIATSGLGGGGQLGMLARPIMNMAISQMTRNRGRP